uniref:Uncharacterized protein n=1 Tax=Arundo donax TaxID=35708 RepID=A0A0A9HDV6_ARUDO
MVMRDRGGGCVWLAASWDLLTIFRQTICSSRWRQQETRCKGLVPQGYCHVGHLHQISPIASH